MRVVESVEELLHDILDFSQGELDIHIGQQSSLQQRRRLEVESSTSRRRTHQIVLAEVKDEIEAHPFVPAELCPAQLNVINNILVLQQLQNSDFAQSSGRELEVVS